MGESSSPFCPMDLLGPSDSDDRDGDRVPLKGDPCGETGWQSAGKRHANYHPLALAAEKGRQALFCQITFSWLGKIRSELTVAPSQPTCTNAAHASNECQQQSWVKPNVQARAMLN